MSHSIRHLFHIDAPRQKVFDAISTIDGLNKWWTVQTSGDASKGGIIRFRFGDVGPDMKVIESTPGETVSWECIASPHGWVGNRLTFSLDENEGKTRVRFAHNGWAEDNDFYAICSFTWGRYMESLRQYCQAGKGDPFGK
jgi:uncharacterized protein YndB with AHSA1/START domain